MLSIPLFHLEAYSATFSTAFLNAIQTEQNFRIQEVANNIFSKFMNFFRSFKNQSREINVKPIAMISCLSLIALLIISIIRRRDSRIIPPPT